jgi:hypothetical protein
MTCRLHRAIGSGQSNAQILQQLHQELNDRYNWPDPGSNIDQPIKACHSPSQLLCVQLQLPTLRHWCLGSNINQPIKACHSPSQLLCVQLQLPTLRHWCLETLRLFEGYCSHQYAHFGFDPSFIHNPTPQLQNYTTVRWRRSSHANRTIEY